MDRDSDIWKVKAGRRPSWGWESILSGRDLIILDCKWAVGDGSMINIWSDFWLTSTRTIIRPTDANIQMVQELLSPSTRQWNNDLIRHLFDPSIQQEIQATYIPKEGKRDQIYWPHNSNGRFSVKSGYSIASQQQSVSSQAAQSGSSSHSITLDFWKHLWKLKTPSKINHFLWPACQNFIPT